MQEDWKFLFWCWLQRLVVVVRVFLLELQLFPQHPLQPAQIRDQSVFQVSHHTARLFRATISVSRGDRPPMTMILILSSPANIAGSAVVDVADFQNGVGLVVQKECSAQYVIDRRAGGAAVLHQVQQARAESLAGLVGGLVSRDDGRQRPRTSVEEPARLARLVTCTGVVMPLLLGSVGVSDMGRACELPRLHCQRLTQSQAGPPGSPASPSQSTRASSTAVSATGTAHRSRPSSSARATTGHEGGS